MVAGEGPCSAGGWESPVGVDVSGGASPVISTWVTSIRLILSGLVDCVQVVGEYKVFWKLTDFIQEIPLLSSQGADGKVVPGKVPSQWTEIRTLLC